MKTQSDKLNERRREIERTLDHVRGEQRTVDENRHWIARSAYLNRCRLLDGLARWYANESKRIDAALRRIREGDYGICLRCRERIDDRRLEASPEATLCANCERGDLLTRRA